MPKPCVCGHLEIVHTGNGVTESACAGLSFGPLGIGGCACVGFTTEVRCDFCSRIPATWTYPTREVAGKMEVVQGEHDGMQVGPVVVSSDAWAACEECAALIEEDDHDGLCGQLPITDLVPLGLHDSIRRNVRQMQKVQFWDARAGDGYRH